MLNKGDEKQMDIKTLNEVYEKVNQELWDYRSKIEKEKDIILEGLMHHQEYGIVKVLKIIEIMIENENKGYKYHIDNVLPDGGKISSRRCENGIRYCVQYVNHDCDNKVISVILSEKKIDDMMNEYYKDLEHDQKILDKIL